MSDRSLVGPVVLGLALTGATGLCLYLLLRNEEEYEYEGGSGSVTSRQVVIDVKIPKDSVGIVIGRQGSNIREIQAKTDTRINFKDELETEEWRVASIRGLPDSAQMAEILIHQTIAAQPKVETLTMTVPLGAVGRIIGKSGDTVRSISRASRCKVDVDRGESVPGAKEKKIELKGTVENIKMAKEMIEEKVREEQCMRLQYGSSNRPPRIKHRQPLFLNYDQQERDQEEEDEVKGEQEELRPTGSDNCMEVFVSAISTPGAFWVQKIGPHSVELDRLTQNMTDYYNDEENQKLHKLSTVTEGDIVVSKFSGDESFYRAKVVSFKEDSYEPDKSTVELDYVDYGDDGKRIICDIFEINTDFLKLKFQAIECCMANIRPFGGSEWSPESCDLFEKLTHCALWKVLFVKVLEYKTNASGQLIPCVELIDTGRLGTDLNIGEEMIREGMAVREKHEDIKEEEKIEHLLVARDN